jgi:phosphatidylglycerophosphate synthase
MPPPRLGHLVAAPNLVVHPAALRLAASALHRGEALDVWEASKRVTDPYAFLPVAVVDSESARRAEAALFRSLRKPGDGWTARFINRHVSLRLTRWLVQTPLRPNQVSVSILLIGLAGAWLASFGTYGAMLGGAALFQLQSILDGCDGEMSRITYRTSVAGEWLDTVGDDVTNYAFFGAAAWGLYRATGNELYAGAGIIAVGAGVIASLIEYRYLVRIGSGDLLKHPASHQPGTRAGLIGAIGPLLKRDTFVLLTFMAAALDALGIMLVLAAAGAVGVLGNVVMTELKLSREETRRSVRPQGGDRKRDRHEEHTE